MTPVNEYQKVIYTPETFREQFQKSDCLSLKGRVSLVLTGLDEKEWEVYRKTYNDALMTEDGNTKIRLCAIISEKVINQILLPIGKILKQVTSKDDLLVQGYEKEKGQLLLYSSPQDLEFTVERVFTN